ncbi:MAG: V-type ATP synthase subunit F [Candidatus Eisenbacteria bacterium]
MKFFVMGDRQTVLGFRLVGIEGKQVEERDDALAALDEAVLRKDLGIVLVTEAVANRIRDEVEARLYGMGFPLVLEIPDASGPSPERPSIEDVVRKAIGISI